MVRGSELTNYGDNVEYRVDLIVHLLVIYESSYRLSYLYSLFMASINWLGSPCWRSKESLPSCLLRYSM